jgi:N-acyl homoserine lactone hydrolase
VSRGCIAALAVGLLAALAGCSAQTAGPRLTVFDCGRIELDDVALFGLTNEETDVRELFVPCYLVEHAGGRLLWDAGLALETVGQGEVELQPGARMSYARGLPDQLAEIGLTPADIDRVAFSHMHFDHVGAANLFPHATLWIQRPEYEAAFLHAQESEVFDPSLYSQLADAPRRLLDGDADVFGDGRVKILSAPGHTPGHQVLWIDLEKLGPIVLAGDLYHFRASRELRRVPSFNADREQTLAAMERVEAIVEETGATLWIEHDQTLADGLRLAPASYD